MTSLRHQFSKENNSLNKRASYLVKRKFDECIFQRNLYHTNGNSEEKETQEQRKNRDTDSLRLSQKTNAKERGKIDSFKMQSILHKLK